MKYLAIALATALLLIGCSGKQRTIRKSLAKSYLITIKTKRFAFSDTGFLIYDPDRILLQIFTAGKPVLEMKVSTDEDNICVQKLCKYKHGFNRYYLSPDYPDTLIEHVLQRQPIMHAVGLKRLEDGFVQHIETPAYAIDYSVRGGDVRFKDRINHILLKLKELHQ